MGVFSSGLCRRLFLVYTSGEPHPLRATTPSSLYPQLALYTTHLGASAPSSTRGVAFRYCLGGFRRREYGRTTFYGEPGRFTRGFGRNLRSFPEYPR